MHRVFGRRVEPERHRRSAPARHRRDHDHVGRVGRPEVAERPVHRVEHAEHVHIEHGLPVGRRRFADPSGSDDPGQPTTASRPPISPAARRIVSASVAASVTSAGAATASPSRPACCSTVAAERATSATRPPSATMASAIAAPIPELAPVTSTFRPAIAAVMARSSYGSACRAGHAGCHGPDGPMHGRPASSRHGRKRPGTETTRLAGILLGPARTTFASRRAERPFRRVDTDRTDPGADVGWSAGGRGGRHRARAACRSLHELDRAIAHRDRLLPAPRPPGPRTPGRDHGRSRRLIPARRRIRRRAGSSPVGLDRTLEAGGEMGLRDAVQD